MMKPCPKCGEEVEGMDLGDHPSWLEFACECGHTWGEDVGAELADQADAEAERAVDQAILEKKEGKP